MKLTVYTFDHYKNGQEIQESLGYKPLAAANIGFNHVLNGEDWATAKSQHHPSEWSCYAAYYLQAEKWVNEGKLYFNRDGYILKCIPDGNAYCCVGEGFVNLQESDNYAFGDTFEEAIENFKKKIMKEERNIMEELEFRIKEILGRTALDNDMEVPEDVQKLARATRYLAAQLFLVCANEVGDKDVANPILKNAVDILK